MYKWHRIGGKAGLKRCVILLIISTAIFVVSLKSRTGLLAGLLVFFSGFFAVPLSIGLAITLIGNLYYDHGLFMGIGIYLGAIFINSQVMTALFPQGPEASCWVVSFVVATIIAVVFYCCRVAESARSRDKDHEFEQKYMKEHGDDDSDFI